jgi:hypothetical protein
MLPTPETGSGILSRPSVPLMELSDRSTHAKCPPEEPSKSAKTPANSTRSGSFYYNQVCGRYPMEWASPAEFEAWHWEEELAYSIKLIASSTMHGRGQRLWMLKCVYIYSCQLSGEQSKYQKKHLD